MEAKAYFFDLDETLIGNPETSSELWLRLCRQRLVDLSPDTVESFANQLIHHSRWFWSCPDRHRYGRLRLKKVKYQLITEVAKTLEIQVDRADIESLADLHYQERSFNQTIFARSLEILEYLKAKGHPLVLITNGASETQRFKINKFNLTRYFDQILIEEEFGVGKPDKSVFEAALSFCKLAPQDCVMIGDNYLWEIAPPKQLGMQTIWIDNKATMTDKDRPSADYIIRSINELPAILAI